MNDEVDGHFAATDMALRTMAQLLHHRGALDLIEFAEELEVRALLLARTDAGSEAAPVAMRAAGVLSELARNLRETIPEAETKGG